MILSLTPNFGRSCELQSMCNIHHCYHRKISQPRERERERESLYLHEKKKDALYGDHDGLFGLFFPSIQDKRGTGPHKNMNRKADLDGICKCSRTSSIFPKD